MNSQAIRWVFVFGLAAMLGILSFQVYWVISNYQSKLEAVEQKVNILLYNVAEGLAKYNKSVLPRENLITRRSSNYYIVNFNDEIDANILEHYLLDEMKRTGLGLDFEYAIYDCDQDQMVYGHYCDIDLIPDNKTNTTLPTYDKFDYYFGVRFPQLRNAVFGDMSMTLILAGLLLITLLFFGIALYIIMSQKRLSDLQRDFINNMTHELKTPLSSIKIAGDTFLHDGAVRNNPRLNKYAQIISDQSGRLNQHVEKILDVARLEGDLVKLNRETFDIIKLLNDIFNDYTSKIESGNGKLQLENDIESAYVYADPLHIANMFHNLIDNAIKYGGKPPIVDVMIRDNHGKMHITIRDNGIGIEKSNLSKIFNKFYRVPTGDVHNTKGFGLGLYYVSQIVKLHRWIIDVESELDKYTSFSITIPKFNYG